MEGKREGGEEEGRGGGDEMEKRMKGAQGRKEGLSKVGGDKTEKEMKLRWKEMETRIEVRK